MQAVIPISQRTIPLVRKGKSCGKRLTARTLLTHRERRSVRAEAPAQSVKAVSADQGTVNKSDLQLALPYLSVRFLLQP